MLDELKRIQKSAEEEIKEAKTLDELAERRIQFLGRERGALTLILRQLKGLPEKERTRVGSEANQLRQKIETLFSQQETFLKTSVRESVLEREWIDVTRPGIKPLYGHLHPISLALREINQIFSSMGFAIAEGPEVELEHYNFDALNIPEHHPARDMWDTFWLKPRNLKLLLRTHTSPVQIRHMEKNNPPTRIIIPGRVYRHEATDASHEIQFYQLEGLMVDKDISIANFKAVIQQFFSRLFGEAIDVRLRPSFFPFTEPSFEVDIRSRKKSSGKLSEWLEISGAGMVHPSVFKAAGLNPKHWQGFAFGMGIDRIAMMKYGIPDVRLFHSAELRFLKQF